MSTPIQEILMLLGAQIVEIHERDKKINMLESLLQSLNEELKKSRFIIDELSPKDK